MRIIEIRRCFTAFSEKTMHMYPRLNIGCIMPEMRIGLPVILKQWRKLDGVSPDNRKNDR